jgi:hypothetical protein
MGENGRGLVKADETWQCTIRMKENETAMEMKLRRLMVVDVDRRGCFDCSDATPHIVGTRSLNFGVLRRLDAQPRLNATPILIFFGGHHDPNNSTWVFSNNDEIGKTLHW